MHDHKQKEHVKGFLKGVAEDGHYGTSGWNLLTLKDLYNKFGGMQVINETVPFRGGSCDRTRKCCGQCVRQCRTRCVQDCLHRLYMWNQAVISTPKYEQDRIPLAIRLIVNQKFETPQQLSWCVGEILSCRTNKAMAKHVDGDYDSHPYKNEYGPAVAIDPVTGKRMVNPITGEIKLLEWPESGLCPYCMPDVTVDTRYMKESVK